MNDERDVEAIVTKFLLNTCRLRPQLSKPAVGAVMHCAELAHLSHADCTDMDCKSSVY